MAKIGTLTFREPRIGEFLGLKNGCPPREVSFFVVFRQKGRKMVGIDRESKNKTFCRFFRGPPPRQRGGRGFAVWRGLLGVYFGIKNTRGGSRGVWGVFPPAAGGQIFFVPPQMASETKYVGIPNMLAYPPRGIPPFHMTKLKSETFLGGSIIQHLSARRRPPSPRVKVDRGAHPLCARK